jgi:hypothetical protein
VVIPLELAVPLLLIGLQGASSLVVALLLVPGSLLAYMALTIWWGINDPQ